jgi:hypothetical protein
LIDNGPGEKEVAGPAAQDIAEEKTNAAPMAHAFKQCFMVNLLN